MGLAPSSDGSVLLKGEEITNFEPHEVAKKGISFVPASRGIFSTLTAYENLKIFHLKHSKWNIDDVFKLFPKLEKLKLLGEKSFKEEENIARVYPNGNLFSHILGQIDTDNNGAVSYTHLTLPTNREV